MLGLCHHLFGDAAFLQVAWPVAAAVFAVEKLVPRVFRGSRFAVISESTRDDLIARGVAPGASRCTIRGSAGPRSRRRRSRARGPRIVYVGRLEAYKNVDLLLRALARLAPRFPDARARTWSGRARSARGSSAWRAALGLAARVHFPGFVGDAERDRLLAGARVCACASAKEGWGLTVIESNALGTPNVASDAPGLRDSVRDGETGFLVPVGDEAAFADASTRLLGDDALAQRMSARRSPARRFDWERAAATRWKAIVARVAESGA